MSTASHHEVLVVGAGLTGLSLGWQLRRNGVDAVVLEASGRAGGVIRTSRDGDQVLEQGPGSLRSGAAELSWLVADLGLTPQREDAAEAANRRFILGTSGLRAMPHGLASLTGALPFRRRDLLSALAEPLRRSRLGPNPTVAELFADRLGPNMARALAQPLVSGIFAGDASQVDAELAFPELLRAVRSHGSLFRGLRAQPRPAQPPGAPTRPFSFHGGLQVLPDALASALGPALQLNAPVSRAERIGAQWQVAAGGRTLRAPQLVLCLTASQVAAIVPALRLDPADYPAAPVAVVTLGWPGATRPQPGFGWLAHPDARSPAMGAQWVSDTFPSHSPGELRSRVLLGGALQPELVQRDDDALIQLALRAVNDAEGDRGAPSRVELVRHQPGIPQAPRGHAKRAHALRHALPGLDLIGWQWTGVGLSHCATAASHWARRYLDADYG